MSGGILTGSPHWFRAMIVAFHTHNSLRCVRRGWRLPCIFCDHRLFVATLNSSAQLHTTKSSVKKWDHKKSTAHHACAQPTRCSGADLPGATWRYLPSVLARSHLISVWATLDRAMLKPPSTDHPFPLLKKPLILLYDAKMSFTRGPFGQTLPTQQRARTVQQSPHWILHRRLSSALSGTPSQRH